MRLRDKATTRLADWLEDVELRVRGYPGATKEVTARQLRPGDRVVSVVGRNTFRRTAGWPMVARTPYPLAHATGGVTLVVPVEDETMALWLHPDDRARIALDTHGWRT